MTADEYDILVGRDAGGPLTPTTPSTAGFDADRRRGTSDGSFATDPPIRPAETGTDTPDSTPPEATP